MKLRTKVGDLLEAYSITAPTLDSKGSSSNLYLQANEKSGFLYLYSTNLITETATKIKADIDTPGEVLINPKKLSDGLQGLAKDTPVSLTLTPTGNALKVAAGPHVKFSLAASVDVQDLGRKMKAIPFKQAAITTMPAAELIEFTKRSVFCIPNDQTGQRANLSALKMLDSDSGEEAFATDGAIAVHVSSTKKQSKGTGIGPFGLLLPAQALAPLSSLVAKKRGQTVDVILTEKRNQVFFKFAEGTYFGALTMQANFPNLKAIVDQKPTYGFQVTREGLKQTLTRASSFVSSAGNKRILELEFGLESLSVIANGDDTLSDQVAITYNGLKPETPVKVGMNIDHLFNIAAGSHSEHLTFGFTAANSPLVVTDNEGEDDDRINVKYVVMGVRLGAAK